MNIRKVLLNLLLIRESETKLVGKLFVFEFFQGSSIALYFTAAISIFLQHRPTSDLPKIFILSALLLWVTGYLYNKFERKLATGKLIARVICFNALIVIVFRLFISHQTEGWYLFLFLSSFNVLYLLNNLEFWGLTAQLFDVRQSKRLFGLVSAGDIPAKMLGYLSAFIFVPFIGTENLLWLAAGLLIISFFLLPSLLKLANINKHSPSTHHTAQSTHSIRSAITGNKLIRKIAIVSFFSLASFLIVNFVFYGYVKNQFKNDNELAGFFAIFFAVIRAITLVIKIAGTNRMVDKIGLRRSLIISPLILFIISAVSINFSFETSSPKAAFYLFGMMAITIDVLRSAIQTPVLLATLQSLPVHQRLRGHTIIKGLLDPLSFFSVGVFLWIFTRSDHPNFQVLSIVLFALTAFWLFFAVSVDKNYKETLQTALRNRTLNERDISITDKESLDLLLKKVESGSETEAISVLKLISTQVVERKEFFEVALNHSSQNVKLYALQIIEAINYREILPILLELLKSPNNVDILPRLILTVNAFDSTYDISSFLNHDDDETVHAATIATFLKSDEVYKIIAEENLINLFNSNEYKNKIKALRIVGELKANHFAKFVINLFADENLKVKQAAWLAAGCIASNETLNGLIKELSLNRNDTEILTGLANGGPSALPYIKDYLFAKECEGAKCRKLILLLVKIGGAAAENILEDCLKLYPENADSIMRSMAQLNIKHKDNGELYKNNLKENLTAGSQILFKLQYAQKYDEVVAKALQSELESIRNKCLWYFLFLYDTETIKKAQAGFSANTKESVANALELIQLAVPKNLSHLFCTMFEIASIKEKCLQLQRTMTEPKVNDAMLVKNILFDIDYTFNNWTKACVLYSLRGREQLLRKEFIEPFLHSDTEVLKDTADFILSKINLSEKVVDKN